MNYEPETCPCRFCGKPTTMLGTQQCDNCWEIWHRVANIDIGVLIAIIVDARSGEDINLHETS